MKDVIAKRTLMVATRDGSEQQVSVMIHRPKAEKDGLPFSCTCTVNGLGVERHRTVYGEDSLQALLLAVQVLNIELYCSEEWKDGRLYWFQGSSDLHLSVNDPSP